MLILSINNNNKKGSSLSRRKDANSQPMDVVSPVLAKSIKKEGC